MNRLRPLFPYLRPCRRSLVSGVTAPVLERGLTLKVTKLLAF